MNLVQFGSKLPICPKGGLFGKLNNIPFVYLFCPIMLQRLKKSLEQIMTFSL